MTLPQCKLTIRSRLRSPEETPPGGEPQPVVELLLNGEPMRMVQGLGVFLSAGHMLPVVVCTMIPTELEIDLEQADLVKLVTPAYPVMYDLANQIHYPAGNPPPLLAKKLSLEEEKAVADEARKAYAAAFPSHCFETKDGIVSPPAPGGPFSILTDPATGLQKYGPFASEEEAISWAKNACRREEFDIDEQCVFLLRPDHSMVHLSASDLQMDEDRPLKTEADSLGND